MKNCPLNFLIIESRIFSRDFSTRIRSHLSWFACRELIFVDSVARLKFAISIQGQQSVRKVVGNFRVMKTSSTALSRLPITSTQVWSRRRDENVIEFWSALQRNPIEENLSTWLKRNRFFGWKLTRSRCLMVPLHNSRFAINLLRNFAGSFTQSSQLKLHDADENCFPARDFMGMEDFNELRGLFSALSGQLAAIRGKLGMLSASSSIVRYQAVFYWSTFDCPSASIARKQVFSVDDS